MAIETWEPTAQERATIRQALHLASARAWSAEELGTIKRLRDILADPTGDMHVWFDAPLVTPEQLAKIHTAQGAKMATSTATTEYGVYRNRQTEEVYVIRAEHGGEENGNHSFISGFQGPFRPGTSAERLLNGFMGSFHTAPEQLEWAEEQSWERLDLVT